MVLRGYFDESERQDGDEPICVAGYIFRPGSYRRFARQWQKFLRDSRPGGLPYLHMTDLYAGQSEHYRSLGDKRADILGRAVELINDHITAGIATVFHQAEFERAAPSWYAQVNGSIYSTACQICMRQTSVWLEDHGCAQLVAYAFERGHKFQHEANAILSKVAEAPRIDESHRYGSHSFVEKADAAGLQAADVLAWTIARATVGFPDNRTVRLFEPHVKALSCDSDRYQLNIFTEEKLQRFFGEQLERPKAYYFQKPSEFRGTLR